MRLLGSCLAFAAAALAVPDTVTQPLVLVNHVGYDVAGPKRAIVQGHKGEAVRSCDVQDAATGARVAAADPRSAGAVARWREWTYWTIDFSSLQREGEFRVACVTSGGAVASSPFRIEKSVLERQTLSDVLYYFKGQRATAPAERGSAAATRAPVAASWTSHERTMSPSRPWTTARFGPVTS